MEYRLTENQIFLINVKLCSLECYVKEHKFELVKNTTQQLKGVCELVYMEDEKIANELKIAVRRCLDCDWNSDVDYFNGKVVTTFDLEK